MQGSGRERAGRLQQVRHVRPPAPGRRRSSQLFLSTPSVVPASRPRQWLPSQLPARGDESGEGGHRGGGGYHISGSAGGRARGSRSRHHDPHASYWQGRRAGAEGVQRGEGSSIVRAPFQSMLRPPRPAPSSGSKQAYMCRIGAPQARLSPLQELKCCRPPENAPARPARPATHLSQACKWSWQPQALAGARLLLVSAARLPLLLPPGSRLLLHPTPAPRVFQLTSRGLRGLRRVHRGLDNWPARKRGDADQGPDGGVG